LAISPTYVSGAFTLAKVLLARGQFAAALAAAEREEPEGGREAGRAIALRALGRERDSKVALADFVAKMGAETPFTVAQVYAFRGERDAAFLWLNRALREHDPDLHTIKGEPLFDNLKSDPRFGEFLRTLKLPE
jgi:serine/threonine-protein kinase